MRRSRLGATKWQVSELSLGTMMFGSLGNDDARASIRIIHTALAAGINLVDTADVYSDGEAEQIVGKALAGRRDSVIVATKFGLPTGEGQSSGGGSRNWIRHQVDVSLRRLATDYIDLYQMHRFDYSTPIEETLETLTDLVTDGKIRAFGSSSFPAEKIVEAQWAASNISSHPFRTEQPRYSIFTRRLEGAVLPTAQRYSLGVLAYSPLNGGWLSGATNVLSSRRLLNRLSWRAPTRAVLEAKVNALNKLTTLATDVGLSLPQLALGFVGAHPAVTSTIIGPRTLGHLEELLERGIPTLSSEVLDRIDMIVPPGTDIDPTDNYNDIPPSLVNAGLRRRSLP